MKSIIRIVILDDELGKAERWKDDLDKLELPAVEFSVLSLDQIQSQLDILFNRRMSDSSDGENVASLFDEVDALIIDYDLRDLKDHRGFATGEEIAYAARLYTKIKVIIVINHPSIGLNDFDLTLQSDKELKGDIYIGHAQIANPRLWSKDPKDEPLCFSPWKWPIITEEIKNFDKCLHFIRENWQNNFFSLFGFDKHKDFIHPESLSYLQKKEIDDVSLENILITKRPPFVRPKDVEGLSKAGEQIYYLATSIIKHWLKRWVLPAQDFLIDIPHLITSIPWALHNFEKIENWNSVVSKSKESDPYKHLTPIIKECEFPFSFFIGVPTFLLPCVRQAFEKASMPGPAFSFSRIPKIIFAEDISRFVPIEKAIEYEITLLGQSQIRAVIDFHEFNFSDSSFPPTDVIYSPQSLLV